MPRADLGADDEMIYLSPPDVGDNERAAILQAFDSGWIAPAGPQLDAFERDLAAVVGAPAAVGLSSGTAALRLSLAIHGIGPGDEVVVPSATFAATAFAVVHAGATPVFIDSDAASWCLDVGLLADFLAERARNARLPKAIIPVSLFGSAPDYDALHALADQYEVPIIEDAAEALGSRAADGPVGSHGHVAIFSFNGNKIITSSSGGAFVGTQAQVDRVRHLATQAREPAIHYEHRDIGFNFRMSNLLAALAGSQLARLESIITRLTEINETYRASFEWATWCGYPHTERPNHWLSVALLPGDYDSSSIAAALRKSNVDARPGWKPMHLQPVFGSAELVGSGAVAEMLFRRGLCLPSGSTLTASQQQRIVALTNHLVGA